MKQASLLLLAVLLVSCDSTPNAGVERAAAELRNTDIVWDGSYLGLVPRISGPPARYLAGHAESARPYLLAALEDSDKFAAAHVLLSIASGQPAKASSTEWNGLVVSLRPDGSAQFQPEQRPQLVAMWRPK